MDETKKEPVTPISPTTMDQFETTTDVYSFGLGWLIEMVSGYLYRCTSREQFEADFRELRRYLTLSIDRISTQDTRVSLLKSLEELTGKQAVEVDPYRHLRDGRKRVILNDASPDAAAES